MKKNAKIVDPVNYPDYGENINDINKKPCKKACKDNDDVTWKIVWDHEISEKIYELEARILASTILLIATLIVGVSNLIAYIIKK
ncbi:hypothetical protein EBT16_13015 [bacterium]|nr:hypothetical protein [bacterium]